MLRASYLPMADRLCRLRELNERDARAYAAGTKDPFVEAYAHLPDRNYTPASVATLIAGPIREGLDRGNLAVLAIADPLSDDFRGSLVFFDITAVSAEVGFWLTAEARGFRLASGALELAKEFARHCGLQSLRARTVVHNSASQRTLHRAGFFEVSRAREATPSGKRVDLIHYRVDLELRDRRTRGRAA